MRPIRALGRAIRFLVWLPFAAASHFTVFILVNVTAFFVMHQAWVLCLIVTLITMGAATPIEARLRPPPKAPRAQLPRREKPVTPAKTRIALKGKGRARGLTAIARRLPPELRAVLASPADRQPEAVLHDQRLLQPAPAAE
ncbi:MAG: hypothetical protein BGO51_24415 [Rhodospirillales bacterium 69-11]|jgi:hypothetical protein|nr:hypothetical protein [Rhodospirillales bacterium]MBN8925666.1 hypothetical protein [Rhodospirillales bacterium]OJW33054.1 MAG: hypothetical protein BGO51_24415 [Rhodospirillales bacterium 69-11]